MRFSPGRLAVAAALLVLLAYLLRLDAVCGLYSDDAWYVLLAKALASGRGFTLINAPAPGLLPMYPPGFPALLAPVFWLASFPANVLVLKAVSIAAMLGTGLLAYRYCTEVRTMPDPPALAVALATALHPAFVFLATSTVMSECVFTLAQLAAVLALERAVRERRGRRAVRLALAGALLVAYAVLTRTMAVALLGAAVLHLAHERLWKLAAVVALGVTLVAAPWFLHARMHAPTAAEQAEQNDNVTYDYATQFWFRFAGHVRLGTVTAAALPGRVWSHLSSIALREVGALHFYAPFRAVEPTAQGPVPGWARIVSIGCTLLVVLGFAVSVRARVTLAELLVPLTLLVTVAWPFPPFRFLLPLLPFVLCYTVAGVRALGAIVRRPAPWAPATALVCACAAASLLANAAYAWQLHGPVAEAPRWNRIFAARMDVMRWLAMHTPADAVVATYDPAQVFLYTDRRTIGYAQPAGAWKEWRLLGVRFFADTSYTESRDPTLPAWAFPALYEAPAFGMRVLDVARFRMPGGRPSSSVPGSP